MEDTEKNTYSPALHERVMTKDGRWGKITGLGGFVGEVRVTFEDGHHEDFQPKDLIGKRLIGSAPELLEALENLTSAVVSGKCRTEKEIEQALSAIKKAKGL